MVVDGVVCREMRAMDLTQFCRKNFEIKLMHIFEELQTLINTPLFDWHRNSDRHPLNLKQNELRCFMVIKSSSTACNPPSIHVIYVMQPCDNE